MIELVIGRRYHVKWSTPQHVWKLSSFDENRGLATLKTTRGKIVVTKIDQLYNVNKNKEK
jgi:hypothetical protein